MDTNHNWLIGFIEFIESVEFVNRINRVNPRNSRNKRQSLVTDYDAGIDGRCRSREIRDDDGLVE
jgi:hypothetical protein